MEIEDNFYEINERQDLIFLDIKKTCIGKKKFTYTLKKELDKNLFCFFVDKYENVKITFPLGEKYEYFSIDVPFCFLSTGLLKTNEIKLIMKISANLDSKEDFENLLIEFCKS
ncbi:MAG: hypothetical protein AABZ74_18135 [Cyanobacteriota bacterium]